MEGHGPAQGRGQLSHCLVSCQRSDLPSEPWGVPGGLEHTRFGVFAAESGAGTGRVGVRPPGIWLSDAGYKRTRSSLFHELTLFKNMF